MSGLSHESLAGLARMETDTRLRLIGYLVFLVGLPIAFGVGTATEILIFGLFALSFNLLWGLNGLLSFGHALFLGTGGYLAALVVVHLQLPFIVTLFVVIIASLLVSMTIGALSLQLRGIHFSIITLAFAQFFYEISYTLSGITGGSDGLIGIVRPSLFGFDLVSLTDPTAYFVFVLVIVVAYLVFLNLLSASLYGRAIRAIRENEDRTKAIGVNTYRVSLLTFTISGIFGSLAGALWALYLKFMSPELLFWSFSGDAVIYSLIGGMYSLVGPVVGATVLVNIEQNLFRTSPGLLNITIGLLFIGVVLFARSGIIGSLEKLKDKLIDTDRGNE